MAQIILAIFVVDQATPVAKSHHFDAGDSFITGKYVKDKSENDMDTDLKAEMTDLKETLYKQGKTMAAMQRIIEKQTAKLDEKDHVIKLIFDKLANTDETVAELKSEISTLKKDVVNME